MIPRVNRSFLHTVYVEMIEMKRVVAPVCAGALLAALAIGCASTAPPPTASTAAARPNQSPNAQSTTDPATAQWENTVQAAKKEGKLVVVSQVGAERREALIKFQQRYPEIQMEYTGTQGRDFAPKVLAEQQAGQYLWDVNIGGSNSMFELVRASAVDVFPRDLPETRPRVNDAVWRKGFEDGLMDDPGKYLYAFVGRVDYAIFLNTDIVPASALRTGQDLLKPEFKGKISWNEPRQTGKGSLVVQQFLVVYGEEFVRKLFSEQDIAVTRDLRQQLEWLVRGAYPIAIAISSASDLQTFQKEGIGLNVRTVDDPDTRIYTSSSGVMSLMAQAPHPNAARLFINWLLSQDGQTAWVESTKVNSRRLDVPVGIQEEYADPGLDLIFLNREKYEPERKQAESLAKELLK